MTHNNNREPHFGHFATRTLFPFAQQFPVRYINGQGNLKIAYRHFQHVDNPQKLVILFNGRGSNILKMTEVIYDLYQTGYDVLAFDHRGQGYSQRITSDKEKSYIDQFRNYLEDVDELLHTIYRQRNYQHQNLLAHSFGALVATAYLANYPHNIERAIFSAPFFGLPPKAPLYSELAVNVMMLLGRGKHYVFGRGPYQPINLRHNDLSSCRSRLKWTNNINRHYPDLAQGGPTFRWLHQCINQFKQLPKYAGKIDIPLLILYAENDNMVSNRSLLKLAKCFNKVELEEIKKAKHELLFERDTIRQHVLTQINKFLAK